MPISAVTDEQPGHDISRPSTRIFPKIIRYVQDEIGSRIWLDASKAETNLCYPLWVSTLNNTICKAISCKVGYTP